jgi:DNA-binding MarR family transcriptional regulator
VAGGRATSATEWARRRSLPVEENEWNAPYARLQRRLDERHTALAHSSFRRERPDPEDLAALALLVRQASRALDRDVGRALAQPHGLRPVDIDVLRRLAVKPCSGAHLTEYLRSTPSQVSRLLGRLAARGLLEKEEDWTDMRYRRARLTSDGEKIAAQLDVGLQRLTALWCDELDTEALEVVIVALALLAELP